MDVTQVSNLSEPERSQNTKKVSARKENEYKLSGSKSSDDIFISDNAKAALEENKLLNIVDTLPSVRQDLVEKLKKEVENDTLLSDEAIQQTAEKLMNGFFI